MRFGSLYSGCGGLDLGLERAGLTCMWQVEIDRHARRVLERHWPGVRRHDDVRTFPPPGTDPEGWKVDLICGGDPCQSNSRAGAVHRRTGEDHAVHFLRVAGALRPRLVLRENPADVRADAPAPWGRFRSGLESLGYAVLPFRLRACCVGADHRRERLFLLAALPDADGERLEGFDGPGLAAGDAGRTSGDRIRHAGRDVLPAPGVCRRSAGPAPGVVKARLTMVGNAVDVRAAEYIGRLILAAHAGR